MKTSRPFDKRRVLALMVLLLSAVGAGLAIQLFVPDAPEAIRGFEKERVTLFQSDIVIESDGRLVVSELIKVVSAGQRMKHGVIRVLPRQPKGRGTVLSLQYEAQSVELDGIQLQAPAPISTNSVWQLFVGQENLPLEPGSYTFGARYVVRGVPEISDLDEGITGSSGAWPTIVDRAEVSVRLPRYLDPATVQVKAWIGRIDEDDELAQKRRELSDRSNFTTTRVEAPQGEEGVLAIVQTNRALSAGEQLLYQIFWPAGFLRIEKAEVRAPDSEGNDLSQDELPPGESGTGPID